jgi:hypothetical protein
LINFRFDFTLVVISLAIDATFSTLRIIKNTKSAKSLRLIKISKVVKKSIIILKSQRALRIIKGFRTIKFLKVLKSSTQTLSRVKNVINKTVLCLPNSKSNLLNDLVQTIFSLIFITFYFFALTAPMIFERKAGVREEDSPWKQEIIGSFRNFNDSFLALFLICTDSAWHFLVYHESYFHPHPGVFVFCVAFYIINALILRPLLLGLIWEVFLVVKDINQDVDDEDKDENKEDVKYDPEKEIN